MKEFCAQVWQTKQYNNAGGIESIVPPNPSAGRVYGLYLFTGDVRHTDGSKVPMDGKYGPDFAAFIKKNKLGKVVMSPEGQNRVNHPTHMVRAWVWSPDVAALKTWYKGVR